MKTTSGKAPLCTQKINFFLLYVYVHGECPGVGGSGRTLSGGQRRVTNTVAGSGMAVPPLLLTFEYGTGSCLKNRENKKQLKKRGKLLR